MRRSRLAILFPFTLLAACGSPWEEGAGEVDTIDLTGLYLGEGEAAQQDRICMVTDATGLVRFGIVTLERDRAACSGVGRVERAGADLRLAMGGDEECVIQAGMQGTRIAFPASVPGSCSYYCSPDATLAGKTFEKTEDTAEAALEAADLVGNPLCS